MFRASLPGRFYFRRAVSATVSRERGSRAETAFEFGANAPLDYRATAWDALRSRLKDCETCLHPPTGAIDLADVVRHPPGRAGPTQTLLLSSLNYVLLLRLLPAGLFKSLSQQLTNKRRDLDIVLGTVHLQFSVEVFFQVDRDSSHVWYCNSVLQ